MAQPSGSLSDREAGEAARLGTRFLVYPQPPFVPGYERPETVWISTPPGSIRAGPADDRVYVVDPVQAKTPYDFPYLPPYGGAANPPAVPGPDGHFDHLAVGTREFLSAHAFACVRRVLDICEGYLGRTLPWFFTPTYERLEIVPHLPWDNAQSGFGFLELGEEDGPNDEPFPFALNFDVIAHETGHAVLFGGLGVPRVLARSGDYLAYHEAVADLVSLLSLLTFDSALDRILRRTRGSLLVASELDRIAELSQERQIRTANHALKLADVGDEVHDRSRPFVGALYDALVHIFQAIATERGLSTLDPRRYGEIRRELDAREIERLLNVPRQDYELKHFALKSALSEARDLIGLVLTGSWAYLNADRLTFGAAAEAIVAMAGNSRAAPYRDLFEDNLAWRGFL
ncbi:hypothetical protein QNA08_08115 [Chelatococcus sp. SYSU_G07232]|uniref:Peptidase M4 C-terminal domain-containing protein n=1 Tax=Chelatococcus albus TaxID=3047466 RepID=A0ABT7AFP2_9HYPH|nr:hypothetical protein [Chelatococcus sp. SYSU_G07232]MDJ1158196.1 hypothetical protein [Chelatococcus sp. SYSU_G07232]